MGNNRGTQPMNPSTRTRTVSRCIAIPLLALGATWAWAGNYSAATGGEPSPRAVEVKDYKQLLSLFDQLDYTSTQWQAGIREIPRVYLTAIPDRWSKTTTKEIEVTLKKQIFFRALGPLALRSNELILQDRKKLQALLGKSGKLSAPEREWLNALAADYGVDPAAYPDANELGNTLLPRVDAVPPSLVLAQAAEESGWGTSRFAFSGNALFGQWTWGGKGIRPEEQRADKGDYKIAAFDAPLESVQAHARNLNTHQAYLQFRIKRAQLRADNEKLSGPVLAGTLTSYSERGQDYVKTLRSIISYNKLADADDAHFGDGQAIVLVSSGGE